MKPRPILKNLTPFECFPSPYSALPFRCLYSPHVHFPPTPTLTDTQVTHSPFAYDRAPIVVSPNTCKLPERGGRMYSIFPASAYEDGGFYSPSAPKESYFHARAFEACEPESLDNLPAPSAPPPLIPDLSSSSEESEDSETYGALSAHSHSPLIRNMSTTNTTTRHTPYPISLKHLEEEDINAFLPYPHSPYPRSPYPRSPMMKGKKLKPKPKGGRDTSRVRFDESFDDTAGQLSLDGCLGGF